MGLVPRGSVRISVSRPSGLPEPPSRESENKGWGDRWAGSSMLRRRFRCFPLIRVTKLSFSWLLLAIWLRHKNIQATHERLIFRPPPRFSSIAPTLCYPQCSEYRSLLGIEVHRRVLGGWNGGVHPGSSHWVRLICAPSHLLANLVILMLIFSVVGLGVAVDVLVYNMIVPVIPFRDYHTISNDLTPTLTFSFPNLQVSITWGTTTLPQRHLFYY